MVLLQKPLRTLSLPLPKYLYLMDKILSSLDWFKEWFSQQAYVERYAHRNENEAKKVVKNILSHISLNEKKSALDCACGTGRHLQYLKEEFAFACGVDLSFNLLKNGKNSEADLQLIRADMRKLPFKEKSFQCIFSLFTSFGYFDDHTNADLLCSWTQTLEDDGYLVLDTINPVHLKNTLIDYSEHRTEKLLFKEVREIKENRIIKSITVTPRTNRSTDYSELPDVNESFVESVRLYEASEMKNLLESRSLIVHKILGNYKGESLDPENGSHDRMIFIAQKTQVAP